jgi:hypothetical protein
MRARILFATLAACTLTLSPLSCSSSGSSTPAGPTVDQACDSYIGALCNQIQKCAPFFVQLVYGDVATCKTRALINCSKAFTAEGTSLTTTKADTCAKDFAAQTCGDLFAATTPSSCVPDPGKLADGTACGDDAQCQSTFCSRMGKTCGVCAKPPSSGAACKEDHDCGHGMNCTNKTNGTGTCSKPVASGGTCDASTSPCGAGLSCFGGKCVAPAAAGAACDPDAKTAPSCDITQGYFCVKNVCKAVKLAKAGETCGFVAATSDFILCAGGFDNCALTAGTMTGVCTAPAADGAACDDAKGPHCTPPAECVSNQCKISDPSACK